MDSETIIFLGIMVLACVIPIVLINRNKKKKEKHFLEALFSLAEKSNGKISEHELWHNAEIGIDREARKLYFIRKQA
jgi:CRISPR/Cas system-associated protein Csm6